MPTILITWQILLIVLNPTWSFTWTSTLKDYLYFWWLEVSMLYFHPMSWAIRGREDFSSESSRRLIVQFLYTFSQIRVWKVANVSISWQTGRYSLTSWQSPPPQSMRRLGPFNCRAQVPQRLFHGGFPSSTLVPVKYALFRFIPQVDSGWCHLVTQLVTSKPRHVLTTWSLKTNLARFIFSYKLTQTSWAPKLIPRHQSLLCWLMVK
jgi:hypothetical protein